MPSPLVFFQLAVRDPVATRAFLNELFDWNPGAPDANGVINVNAGGPGDFDVTGSLMPLQEGHQQATLFFRVENLEASVARAEEIGATIVVPIRRASPAGPHIALVATPDGELTLGIVQA